MMATLNGSSTSPASSKCRQGPRGRRCRPAAQSGVRVHESSGLAESSAAGADRLRERRIDGEHDRLVCSIRPDLRDDGLGRVCILSVSTRDGRFGGCGTLRPEVARQVPHAFQISTDAPTDSGKEHRDDEPKSRQVLHSGVLFVSPRVPTGTLHRSYKVFANAPKMPSCGPSGKSWRACAKRGSRLRSFQRVRPGRSPAPRTPACAGRTRVD